jgi:hypothetical protein
MAAPGIPHWQAALLARLGYKDTPQNELFLTDWSRAEGGGATNNPFNTTQPGFHSTGKYNSVGVQNYGDPNSGLDATVHTLRNGRYGSILAALQQGNNARAAAQALANSPWGTGALVMKMLGGGATPPPPISAKQGAIGLAAQSPAPDGSSQRNALLGYLSSSLGNYAKTGQAGGNPVELLTTLQAAQAPPALNPFLGGGKGHTAAPVASNGPSHGIVTIPGTSYQANSAILPNVESITKRFGVRVNSAYRSAEHNAKVGGAPHSDHLSGNAIDFVGTPQQMRSLYQWAQGRFPYVEPWGQAGGNHVHISFIR